MSEIKNIEQLILFQLDKTNKAAKQYSQREFERLGLNITVEQWILLKIIQESSPISQKEIAEKALRDPASITRTINILENKGLVSRENIPENKRQYDVVLTTKGSAFVAQNMATINAHRSLSIQGFSDNELIQLSSMLLKIQENMK